MNGGNRRAAALRMVDSEGCYLIRESSGEASGVAEPRGRYEVGVSAKILRERAHSQRVDTALFDRLGVPVPIGGGRREGLNEAITRTGGRSGAFSAGGGARVVSLVHEPVDWAPADPEWKRREAWMLREPWADRSPGWEEAKEFRKRGWSVLFHPCTSAKQLKRGEREESGGG